MSEQKLIKQLEQLTNGLLWLSESDYPWQIVAWEKQENSEKTQITPLKTKLLTINPEQDSLQLEEQELENFFQEVITIKDWYGEEELAECQRYQDLVNFLKNSLSAVKVYRLGKVEVKIYVLGQSPNGNILGIETISVET